ncbi:hypothetical protein Tco_1338855 [Tanacetum coccineum]
MFIPTNEETKDETDDVTEEEYERINEELYGDVNVSLTDVELADKEKDDKEKDEEEMIVACHKTEGPIPSSSISYDYAAKYLNFDNIPPEHNVANPPEIVTTTSPTTISSLLSSLFLHLQQLTPIPTPTTTKATTSTIVVFDSEPLSAFYQRITNLEKGVKELKTVDHSAKHSADITKEHSVPTKTVERLRQQYVLKKSTEDIIKIKMEHARQQQVPKETITSSDTTALTKFDQETTLFETMTKSKSFNKIPKQRALYRALMESILKDGEAMDEGVANKFKKRKQDDADKDEGPSTRSDRGLKRRKTNKDTEPSKKANSTETSKGTSKGTSKSQPKSTNKSA